MFFRQINAGKYTDENVSVVRGDIVIVYVDIW